MGCVTGQLVRLDALRGQLARIERVCGAARRIERVDGTVSRVCSVGSLFYLRVTPVEPQWITPDTPLVYQVECNTAWRVE